jgi:chromosomal replication initiation ATPase DnaA
MLTTIRQGKGYYIRATSGEGLTPKEKYEELQINVCKATGIKLELIKKKNRKREVVLCRYLIFYIARHNGLGSFKFLATNLNGFDHSTVMHGVGLIQDLLDSNDKEIKVLFNSCKHLLRA